MAHDLWWQMFPWARLEIFLCVIIIISLLRWPPVKASGIQDMVERHWGDWIGIFLVSVGISVTLFACLSPTLNTTGLTLIVSLGSQLVAAGFVALKLRTTAGAVNGNGTPVSTQTTHTETITEGRTVAPTTVAMKPIAPVGYYDAEMGGVSPVGKPARFVNGVWVDATTGVSIP